MGCLGLIDPAPILLKKLDSGLALNFLHTRESLEPSFSVHL